MNPWHELGLSEDADEAEIRRAYRRLAAEHHPDRNPDDDEAAERFQRVRQAYDMLRHPTTAVGGNPWPDIIYGASGHGPQEAPWPPQGDARAGEFGDLGSGMHVRFVAPPQMRALLTRLRRVLALTLAAAVVGITALGHGLRGLPWSELMWPHHIIVGFGTGLVATVGAFFAWIFAVFLLGFRLGTFAFWALVALQLLR